MQCDHCQERPAAIHLTQIVNNSVTTVHLCDQCAAEKGVQTGATVAKFPLSDFLASMGKGAASQLPPGDTAAACEFCGATLQDFRDTGRLGCARCYDALITRAELFVERTRERAATEPIERALQALNDAAKLDGYRGSRTPETRKYAGYHTDIWRQVLLREIQGRDAWNNVAEDAKGVLVELARAFGMSQLPHTYWDESGELSYAKRINTR